MFKGQKCMRNGVEDFLCPFTKMNITQGANGVLSHLGTMANDVAGSGDRDPYYTPCTVKCIAVYPDSGQSMWQSINPVRFANGNIDYATFMIAHDNSQNCYVGQIVTQGEQLGNMGNKGYATGIHCHIEIEQGSDTTWKQNEYGVWCFNNEVDTDDCYFVDSTEIINGMGGNWKCVADVPVDEPIQEPITTPPTTSPSVDTTIEELNNTIAKLKQRLKDVQDQLLELKNDYPKHIYTCLHDGKYIIELYENENLYIK